MNKKTKLIKKQPLIKKDNEPGIITNECETISLDKRITTLEENIKAMNTISGLKDHVEKYNQLNNDLNECKQLLDYYKNKLTFNCILEEDVDDQKFTQLTEELNKLKEVFSNEHDIDKIISLYADAKQKIDICNKYLLKQKLEIITT